MGLIELKETVRLKTGKVIVGMAATLLFSAGSPALANGMEDGHHHIYTDPHKQNVEHLLEMLGFPEQVNLSASEVMKVYSAKVTDDSVDENIKDLVDAYQADMQRAVGAVLSWDAIKPNYIRSYANRMSSEDVANVRQFMESSSGRAFFDSQNTAGKEIQQITKRLIESDLAEPLKELRNQLQQSLASLRPQEYPK